MTHLTTSEIEAFVAAELGADRERVHTHVRHCEACARRLAEEARLDLAMRDAAARLVGGQSPPARAGLRTMWLRRPEMIAMAAGLLFLSVATLWPAGPSLPDRHAQDARAALRPSEDTPGLHARRRLGPGSDLMPNAEAFRDTGAGAPGMLDSLGRL